MSAIKKHVVYAPIAAGISLALAGGLFAPVASAAPAWGKFTGNNFAGLSSSTWTQPEQPSQPAQPENPAEQPSESQDVATLKMMHEEERMAYDLYTALNELWGSRKLTNISASEQNHMSQVAAQLERLGAEPHTGLPAGTYAYPELQALYDDWYQRGSQSMDAAHAVGAELERRDIADLKDAKSKTQDPELIQLYDRLIAASENHLAAFERGGGMGPGHGGGKGPGHGGQGGRANG